MRRLERGQDLRPRGPQNAEASQASAPRNGSGAPGQALPGPRRQHPETRDSRTAESPTSCLGVSPPGRYLSQTATDDNEGLISNAIGSLSHLSTNLHLCIKCQSARLARGRYGRSRTGRCGRHLSPWGCPDASATDDVGLSRSPMGPLTIETAPVREGIPGTVPTRGRHVARYEFQAGFSASRTGRRRPR